MSQLNFLGFDFGASSGRAMLGTFENGKMEIQEIHRFSNDPVMLCGRFVWDLPRLVYEMKQALLKLSRMNVKVSGIGIDTWGVDFGLLERTEICWVCRCTIATRAPRAWPTRSARSSPGRSCSA